MNEWVYELDSRHVL